VAPSPSPSSRRPTPGRARAARPAGPASPARRALERASLPLLTRLAQLPRAVPFLAMLALLVGGVLLGGPVGAVLVGLVALVVAWLLVLAWPALTGVERLGRIAVLLLAVALCVVQVPRG
jgi:hypothetical protein